MSITTLPNPEGEVTYKNINFEELNIRWKTSPGGGVPTKFTALSAWLNETSEAIPEGSSKVSWDVTELVGDVDITVEGANIKLPAGYVYKLRSDVGVFKAENEETNVFYQLNTQWVTTEGQIDTAIGTSGNTACEGTGSQEVRNRVNVPAVAYVQAGEDTIVSLEVSYQHNVLHLAKGSQVHIEVVGPFTLGAEKKVTKAAVEHEAPKAIAEEPHKVASPQARNGFPWRR